jgi:hypothetical protein
MSRTMIGILLNHRHKPADLQMTHIPACFEEMAHGELLILLM